MTSPFPLAVYFPLAEGWRFVACVRWVPLFPFNLSNYALGVTRIPLHHYVLATPICIAPGAIAYTWLGHAGCEALASETEACATACSRLLSSPRLPNLIALTPPQGYSCPAR